MLFFHKDHQFLTPLFLLFIIIAVIQSAGFAQTISYFEPSEEFIGPFSSWKNLKTDFQASGLGATNDAPALQRALDSLKNVNSNTWSVLYIPAGTYRIDASLSTFGKRLQHNDYLGISIIGEDPATTVIKWNGPADSNMLNLDAWYSKVSRLTFDGNNTANIGLLRDGGFSTYCELSDLYFRNCKRGIQMGGYYPDAIAGGGQAEHMIMRCRFVNCGTSGADAGIVVKNYNSLDIYIWYSSFEDCYNGITNVCGAFHAYQNIFLRSKNIDCNIMGTFDGFHCNHAIVNNISVQSRRFIINDYAKWATALLLQGNRIYDWTAPAGDTGECAIATGGSGAQCILDNIVRSSSSSDTRKPFRLGAWDQILVGNTVTTPNYYDTVWHSDTIAKKLRYRILSTSVVNRSSIPDPVLSLPGAPVRHNRKIFEVVQNTGNDAQAIQTKIDSAALETVGTKPIVHIRKGSYTLTKTLVVPAGTDMQITGDGNENGTRLNASAVDTGIIIKATSRATIRDFSITGNKIMVIEDSDVSGGRIFANQLLFSGGDVNHKCDAAMLIDGIDNTDIQIIGSGFGSALNGIVAKGGPVLTSGGTTNGQALFLTGASSHAESFLNVRNNAKLIAAGYWYEGDYTFTQPSVNLTPTSSGKITATAMFWAVGSSTLPIASLESFSGTCAIVANQFVHYSSTIPMHWMRIKGASPNCNFMSALNVITLTRKPITDVDSIWRDSSTSSQAAFVNCGYWGNFNDTLPQVTNRQHNVQADSNFILSSLAQLRGMTVSPPTARAQGVTDFSIVRVNAGSTTGGTTITIVPKRSTGINTHTMLPATSRSHEIIKKMVLSPSMVSISSRAKSIKLFDVRGRLLYQQEQLDKKSITDLVDKVRLKQISGIVIEKIEY